MRLRPRKPGWSWEDGWKARFWDLVLRAPFVKGPLWHMAFSFWDDAVGCGCWSETGRNRWGSKRA